MDTILIDLKRKREKAIAEARACHASLKPGLSDDVAQQLESQFNQHMADVRELDLQIAENTVTDTRIAGLEPPNARNDSGSYEIWRDRDGREVRAHDGRKSIQFSKRDELSREFEGISFGRMLRGMLVPALRSDAERRALGEATDAAGGVTVPTVLMQEFIDKMRARARIFQAGARVVEMGSNTVDIARVTTDPTVAWRNENADVNSSDPVFDKVSLSAKSMGVIVPVSKELTQDTANLDRILESVFAGSFAAELDRAALFGSGSAPEPQGIFGTTGVLSTSMDTNGAAITDYSEIITAHQKLMEANADAPTANIMAPRTWATYAGFQDTTGQPLIKPQQIANTPDLVSTNVPINQTQGTANNASSIITGDFTQMLIGIRMDMMIQVLTERYADKAQNAFLVWWRGDVQTAHPESFHRLIGITP